ncbi:ribosome biogenesis GTPase Der [Anaplasma capra]|uniref:ribosome biogenesis GTPase Der n=1 Tax=Anaplasma capra TaxID=1562740 RepID=UPI0021D56A0D|nr:ribosome biogenesis GTPase Der [Anaplasma capra]MCU7611553.1 ribosome biogenesis GTPase Der [Anaplasma capra]MCU7612008.1 ribosome biogenesis GTPase Der [Anaplasma capra]
MQKVAIVGLPNVGKSTLFNKLIKRKSAIVSSVAHVTRDRKEGAVNFCGLKFIAIDTGGVGAGTGIQALVTEQVELAIECTDVILFVVDSKKGTDAQETDFAKWLRKKTDKPVVLVVNKCESNKHCAFIDDMEYLGFLGPVYISAEHSLGMPDLYEILSRVLECNDKADVRDKQITISIIGQPNVGKSTFVNSILGEKRVITDDSAGTTRDSISVEYRHKGVKLLLTDTAGIRRRTKVVESMEKLSVQSATDALSRSNVVVLMVDFTLGINRQDLSIAEAAMREGKSMVVVMNKSDLVDSKAAQEEILRTIRQHSRVDFDVPIMKISALHGTGCNDVLDRAIGLYKSASSRISTAKLNKWLNTALEHHAPHLQDNKKVRLKYITQVSALPPTFMISTNTEHIEDSYQQYLRNSFIKSFSMQGVPIRMIFRKGHNPYSKDR